MDNSTYIITVWNIKQNIDVYDAKISENSETISKSPQRGQFEYQNHPIPKRANKHVYSANEGFEWFPSVEIRRIFVLITFRSVPQDSNCHWPK